MTTFHLSAFADEADASLAKQIEALNANGVAQIEMRGVNGKSVANLTDAEAREARAMLKDGGISLWAMGSPFGKYPIDEPFEIHLEAFKRGLELCDILGTKRVRMFSFFMKEGEDPAVRRTQVIDQLGKMLDLADDAGLALCHENERDIFGDVTDRCVDLMEAFGGRMGFVFDPANFLLCGVKPKEAWGLLDKYTSYMHVKDVDLKTGAIVPSGAGDGEISWTLSQLAARGGDFTLSVEPHLTIFDGLKDLQREGLTHKYQYPDKRTAFDAAVSALKEVLAENNYREGGAGVWKK